MDLTFQTLTVAQELPVALAQLEELVQLGELAQWEGLEELAAQLAGLAGLAGLAEPKQSTTPQIDGVRQCSAGLHPTQRYRRKIRRTQLWYTTRCHRAPGASHHGLVSPVCRPCPR